MKTPNEMLAPPAVFLAALAMFLLVGNTAQGTILLTNGNFDDTGPNGLPTNGTDDADGCP